MNKPVNQFLPHLALCILFDAIGYASYIVPLLGESFDLIWAPIAGFIFYYLFGGKMGLFGGGFAFLEEILPFSDFIPTFTIAWFIRKRSIEKDRNKSVIIKP